MSKKESVFVSAVLYLSDYAKDPENFTRKLLEELRSYFEHFEVIVVDDCCTKHDKYLKEVLPSIAHDTITVVHMSVKQGIEMCLKAGLDVSIGDFVYEFDTLEFQFDNRLLWDVYQEALKGNDVVSVEPNQNNFTRKVFYHLFNKYSYADYDIHASAFRLVSRRAINRILDLGIRSAFRQAVYASCGLKNSRIAYKGTANPRKSRGFGLALDSFLLYTDLSKRICTASVILALMLTVAGCVGLFVPPVQWLFGIAVLLGMLLISTDLIVLLYYGRLLLQDKDTKYLISNIEKVEEG